jgi:hypothetical protein
MSDDLIFPSVPQPEMNLIHEGPGSRATRAIIDNRTDLPDHEVRGYIEDRWTELGGLQYATPNSFQMYANAQGSLLARTPYRTPQTVNQEIELARSLAESDDDAAAAIGLCLALAYGEGVQNHHRDEGTVELFNQMMGAKGLDLEAALEELHREFLIGGSVTSLTLFTRQRMSYFPMRSVEAVQAQLQVPRIGILPAEGIRVISNDILGQGRLAFFVGLSTPLKLWLDEYFSASIRPERKAFMAMEEPVAAQLFVGKYTIPWDDGDISSRGREVFILNDKMVHRTSMAKGALPYARPPLTANFALLEAKRLLNIMDHALLVGGTNYIIIAKKGSDGLPAQQPEIDNLRNQITHASRSGVLVGDHRLNIEIITPDLKELLNPLKRKLLGRKIAMRLLRQVEQVTSDAGTQGALNELEFIARVIGADRRRMIKHVDASFYEETANRNRSTFKEGAPTIAAPKLILANVKDFWANVLQASDRGLLPHRYVVETLGFDYQAALAERERELARGDDEVLVPGSVPFSSTEAGPQDNGPGRPRGTSSNNGSGRDVPGQGRDPFAPRHVIKRTAGETITAMVENNEVTYIGATTRALLEQYEPDELAFGYVVESEREAIEANQTMRAANSVIVPVNPRLRCNEYRTVKLADGLRMVVGRHIGDDAMVARALRFTEPHFDLRQASEYALRWGFVSEPLVEVAGNPKRCINCGAELPDYSAVNPVCPECNTDNTGWPPTGDPAYGPIAGGSSETGTQVLVALAEQQREIRTLTDTLATYAENAKGHVEKGKYIYLKCPNCGLVQDADHSSCSRCGHDLTDARKAMFAYYEQKGVKPTLHSTPPPPASRQKDYRKDEGAWEELDGTLLDDWALAYHNERKDQ